MKSNGKAFLFGLISGVVGVSTVFASNTIQSAEYNNTKIVVSGERLDVSTTPMISIINNGASDVMNYMPVRGVLEQMGYSVIWDGRNNTIYVDRKTNASAVGQTIRNELIRSLGIDESSSVYRNFEATLGLLSRQYGYDETLLTLMVANDYWVFADGGEAIFSELWEKIYGK